MRIITNAVPYALEKLLGELENYIPDPQLELHGGYNNNRGYFFNSSGYPF